MERGLLPSTVEEIFINFKGRRAGILKALTSEVEDFFLQCNPDFDNLCLYGFPDEHWEVKLPSTTLPPQLPEPAVGINFARDGLQRKEWLLLVAVHSDAWIVGVAHFYSSGLSKSNKKMLFNMINELPTVYEIVLAKYPAKEATSVKKSKGKSKSSKRKASINNSGRSRAKSGSSKMLTVDMKRKQRKPVPPTPPPSPNDGDETSDDGGDHGQFAYFCNGICTGPYSDNEVSMKCESCNRWFHERCVTINPAISKRHYKCSLCRK